ncbi:hypothetical protein A4V01_05770 [Erysipelotrichaceae bacterium I46]|nr:hypothetical protein A4V01_05770 [Erysipelotrichaceae bacterium I46]ASU19089.1 hypothetical protein ADH65_11545 [[Clostridium] innocuum]
MNSTEYDVPSGLRTEDFQGCANAEQMRKSLFLSQRTCRKCIAKYVCRIRQQGVFGNMKKRLRF